MSSFGLAMIFTCTLGWSGDDLVRVYMKSAATVDGELVHLEDIASITSFGEGRSSTQPLGQLVIPANFTDNVAIVDIQTVKQVAASQGHNLGAIQFLGAFRTRIEKRSSTTTSQSPNESWEAVLHRALRQSVEQSMHIAKGVEISLEGRRAFEFLEQQNPADWSLALPPAWQSGNQVVTLEVPTETGVARYPIQVTIKQKRQVVVARKRIPQGIEITEDDVMLETRVLTADNAAFVTQMDEVVGKQAAKTIEAHQVLCQQDTKSPPLVFRGSRISVLVSYRTASLEMTAIAAQDGGLGDWIEAINPTTKKPLQQRVRVVDLQTAVLDEQTPPQQDDLAIGTRP